MTYKPYNPAEDVISTSFADNWTDLSVIQKGFWHNVSSGMVDDTIHGPALIVSGIVSKSRSAVNVIPVLDISVDDGNTWTAVTVVGNAFAGLDTGNDGRNGMGVIEPIYISKGRTFKIRAGVNGSTGSTTYEIGAAYHIKYKPLPE